MKPNKFDQFSSLAPLLLLIVLISSCAKYIQIYETRSALEKNNNDNYVFENDTLKISYAFWASNGVMSFKIKNKLSVPIYIDWKKSAFIHNDLKLNYYADETIIRSNSQYYLASVQPDDITYGAGSSSTNSKVLKRERITFIPPNSEYFKFDFMLLSKYLLLDINSGTIGKKANPIYYMDFNSSNSPLVFRNFLSISVTEDFKSEFYIDDEFYVSSIKEMKEKVFIGKKAKDSGGNLLYGTNGKPLYERPYQKMSSFYIYIPTKATITRYNLQNPN